MPRGNHNNRYHKGNNSAKKLHDHKKDTTGLKARKVFAIVGFILGLASVCYWSPYFAPSWRHGWGMLTPFVLPFALLWVPTFLLGELAYFTTHAMSRALYGWTTVTANLKDTNDLNQGLEISKDRDYSLNRLLGLKLETYKDTSLDDLINQSSSCSSNALYNQEQHLNIEMDIEKYKTLMANKWKLNKKLQNPNKGYTEAEKSNIKNRILNIEDDIRKVQESPAVDILTKNIRDYVQSNKDNFKDCCVDNVKDQALLADKVRTLVFK